MKIFALLTCDAVLIDAQSGKHFIQGHFSSIRVSAFPATHPRLTLFTALTDIPSGPHTLELRLTRPADTTPATPPEKKWSLFGGSPPPPPATPDPVRTLLTQPISSTGPAQRLYNICEVTDLTLDKEGTYTISVYIDKTEVGSIGLEVVK